VIKRIAIVIAGIVVIVLGRGFFFYSGFYSAPAIEVPSYEHIVVLPAPSAEFSDNASEEGDRTVLIDLAHNNNFDIEELNVLMLRLISRGLTIKLLSVEDDLEKELLGELKEEEEAEIVEEEELAGEEEEVEIVEEEELAGEEEEAEIIEEEELVDEEEEEGDEEEMEEEELEGEDIEEEPKLPNAFIIVCPRLEFSQKEKEAIGEFVDNGGKLLLTADPTRHSEINNIAIEFGLIFEPDYLYNMKENEINYSNIFVAEFEENEITKSLEKIVLYVAGSISSTDGGIAFIDQNTFSSVIESRKRLSPIALVEESKILAVYDLTFMSEPYNGTLDNNQLIANIADWLASPTEEQEQEEPED